VNPATNCVSVADEEKLLSFEAGVKSEIARKLRLNLGAFVYTVDGQQIVAVGGQYNTATLLNGWARPTTTPRSTTRTWWWRPAAVAARSRTR
jgi:hypothetical protein